MSQDPPITTPRKHQKQGQEGLLTPPDSHHKHTTQDSADSGRKGKRRRVEAYEPDPPGAPFPTPGKTPRKIVLTVGGRRGAEADARTTESTSEPITQNAGGDSQKEDTTPIPILTPKSNTKQTQKQKANDLTPWKRTDVLPPHLANLLALHKSFDLALSLHIATHPPVLPPPPATTSEGYGKEMDVRLEALTNYVAMRPIVEKSCGKRFGLSELKRLMWLWNAVGDASTTDDDGNPFIDAPSSSSSENPTSCYTVSPTRTIDPTTSRRTHTYGFGLVIRLTPREAASYVNTLHHGDGDGGHGTVGAVARWSAGSEGRLRVVEGRLWDWVGRHEGLVSFGFSGFA